MACKKNVKKEEAINERFTLFRSESRFLRGGGVRGGERVRGIILKRRNFEEEEEEEFYRGVRDGERGRRMKGGYIIPF